MNQMYTYVVSCCISRLKPIHVTLLEQAGCRVDGGLVTFDLIRDEDESSDDFRERGERWIRRELSRLNVLTGDLFDADSILFEPPEGNITINLAAVWAHAPQMPPKHTGWSDEGHEFRVGAWDTASHTEDDILRFVMLDSICESAGVPRKWEDKSNWPPRFAEVRLVRNLIVHGSETPNEEVIEYLDLYAQTMLSNRFANRKKHLKLARQRSAHLMACVWNIVVNGCVNCEVELFSGRPAGTSGIVVETQGPCSMLEQEAKQGNG